MNILRGWIKQKRSTGIAAVSIMLALALVASACAPVAAAPAEKERVVKMGLAAGFLGPIATVGAPWSQGVIDYARYVNEQGGIDGIRVEVPWYEARSMVPDTILAHRRLVGQGAVIIHNVMSTPCEAELPLAQRDEIPLTSVTALTEMLVTKPQWAVVSLTDWPSAFMMSVRWIKENLWTEARPMRVGTIFYDVSSGWSTIDCVKYFEKIGVEFVGYEVIPYIGCIDTSTELLRLASKKPDWIYLTSYGAPTVTVVKDIKRLGLQEAGIKFLASPNTIDECTLNIVKRDADGWHSAKLTPSYYETDKFPELKTLLEAMKRYRGWPAEELRGFYVAGWAHSAVGVEAIRLAIEKVGYENLTGRAVRDALMSIKDFELGFLYPVTTSDKEPFIVRSTGIYPIREGTFQVPIDWVWILPSLYMSPQEFERALEK